MRTLFALPLTFLLCALPAQDKSPFRFVPADANLVVRLSAPSKWQQQFAKAQITKLFQSQTLAPMVGMMQQGYSQMIEGLRGQGTVDADLIDALVTTYTGDIVIAAKVDLSNLEEMMQTGERPEFEVMISLSPDGSFDLAKIAAEIEKAADKNPPTRGKVRELSVGNLKTRMLENDDVSMTLPTLVDGHLVAFFGTKLEPQVNRAMAATGHYTGGNDTSSMFVHLELGGLMKAMTSAFGQMMDMQGAPFDGAEMMRTLGIESLQNFDLSLTADGEHMQIDSELGLAGELGLLGAMVADQPSLKLLRAVPDDVDNFNLMTLDAKVLFEIVGKVWKSMGDEAPMSWDDAMAQANEATKLRLKEDLFDHLGAQMLFLNPTTKDGAEEEEPRSEIEAALQMLPGCMALELKNGKAFGESMETMIRSFGLQAARKTEEYQGHKVHKLNVGGMLQIEYAVTDDMLLLSLRNDELAQRTLRSALDAQKTAEGEMPARIKSLVAGLPEGWTGLTVASMSETLKNAAKAMQMQAEMGNDMPPQAEMVFGMMQSLGEEMKRLGIDRAVTTTHTSKSGMRSRMRM